MKNETTTTRVAAQNSEYKDTKRLSDLQTVFNCFFPEPRTMMQVSILTYIPTQYVCWYVRHLRMNGNIQIVRYGRCPQTGYDGVQFLTTNPDLFRKMPKQLNLFENEQG
jgi:hypothetical protein